MKKMKKVVSVFIVIAFAALLSSVYAGNSLGSGYAVTSDWHGKDVPPGTTVTVTAMTTDDTITQVTFLWKDPEGNLMFEVVDNTATSDGEFEGKTIFTFSSAEVVSIRGDWGVQALFQGADGKTKEGIDEVVSTKATSFFVVPDLPLIGTLGATMAGLLGLGLFAVRRKRAE